MAKIGFIGVGNMGYAILKGISRKSDQMELVITDVDCGRVSAAVKELGAVAAENNCQCVKQSQYVILAVKPQYYIQVLEEIKGELNSSHIIISIAPGITIADLKSSLGDDKRIIRAMPNTPALVGEGMTGVCYDRKDFSEEEQNTVREIFESFGKMRLVEERLMSAVVCVSGSSPAYVYLFIEALADSGVKYGLPRDVAYEMACQTLIGSARMVLETGEHPGLLKDRVCSPGGTTIEGVAALEEYGFRNAVIKAADACYSKSEKMR